MENKTAEDFVFKNFPVSANGNCAVMHYSKIVPLLDDYASLQCAERDKRIEELEKESADGDHAILVLEKQIEKLEGMWQASERLRRQEQAEHLENEDEMKKENERLREVETWATARFKQILVLNKRIEELEAALKKLYDHAPDAEWVDGDFATAIINAKKALNHDTINKP